MEVARTSDKKSVNDILQVLGIQKTVQTKIVCRCFLCMQKEPEVRTDITDIMQQERDFTLKKIEFPKMSKGNNARNL